MAQEQFDRLVEIMSKLRGQNGCPWDQIQNHESLRPYLLEETYEVLESIDNHDYQALKLELGDLLLQVVFHAQIARDNNMFTIDDVIQSINDKLVRRHPHVFGDAKIRTAEEQIINWEKVKKKEGKRSVIDGVPQQLPALLCAHRIQQKAASVGFDWDNTEQVWDKVEEEFKELKSACKMGLPEKMIEEFGDLLFSLVNLSRFLDLNPEDALRVTIKKFSGRFQQMEKRLKARGLDLADCTLAEMDAVWDEIKLAEHNNSNR